MEQPSERIDGSFLVLTDRTALPPRCVQTNQPVSERECQIWNLPWLPPWLTIVMCISPVFLMFAPYVVRKRCHVQAGISQGVRLRYLFRKLLAGLLIVGSILIPILCIVSEQPVAAMAAILLFPFLFWGGFIILILFTSPLTIHRCAGEYFWLKGCSPEFLASLQEPHVEVEPISPP
jgi:hypothetical protein